MDISYREKHNLETIYPYLGECTLFLARDDSFPLSKPCSIAAYGRGVRHTIKGGSGSGDVNSRFFITIEEGLEKAGFVITSKEWLDEADRIHDANHPLWIKETKKKAKQFKTLSPIFAIGRVMPEVDYNLPLSFNSDAAIYVISRMSGEGSDREFISGDILLTESEIRDIKELNKRYSKFMLVINAGDKSTIPPALIF